MKNNINFICPNCNSSNYIGKTTSGKRYSEGPYKNIHTEIQCGDCFMDLDWAEYHSQILSIVWSDHSLYHPQLIRIHAGGALRGFDITIVTTAKTDKEALVLLKGLGLPLASS